MTAGTVATQVVLLW